MSVGACDLVVVGPCYLLTAQFVTCGHTGLAQFVGISIGARCRRVARVYQHESIMRANMLLGALLGLCTSMLTDPILSKQREECGFITKKVSLDQSYHRLF